MSLRGAKRRGNPLRGPKKQKKCKIFQKSFALLFFVSIFAVPKQREPNNRGVAQLASASGLGPEGPVFESQYPDKIQKQPLYTQVVAFFCTMKNKSYICDLV